MGISSRFRQVGARGDPSARRELIGIADALVQRLIRVVAASLTSRVKSASLGRQLTAQARKLAAPRLDMLCNMGIVAAHNEGRLDQFEAAGVTKVGSSPRPSIGRTRIRPSISRP